MRLYFEDAGQDAQLQRTVAKCDYGMANAGESLTIAAAIEPGDRDSWHRAFFEFGDGLRTRGTTALASGHVVSAGGYYLRAAEYFRNVLLLPPRPTRRRCAAALVQRQPGVLPRGAADATNLRFAARGRRAGCHLRRLPRAARPGAGRSAAGDHHAGGYDGTAEEGYPTLVEAAARGYAAYSFDGPGQGGTLYEQRVFMRPDWEHVLPPVFDAVASRSEVDESRIALLGRSFGGYLAPRAAAGEPRLAALMVDPGQFDLGLALKARLGDELSARITENSDEAAAAFEQLLRVEPVRKLFAPRMATHGAASVQEYLRSMLGTRTRATRTASGVRRSSATTRPTRSPPARASC